MKNQNKLKLLQTIQRQFTLRMSKAYKTVSTEALQVITNTMPIDLYIEKTALNYFLKKGINNYLTEEYLSEDRIDLELIQKPYPSKQMIHYDKRKPISICNAINTNLVINTDGSKSREGVGSGFCMVENNEISKAIKGKFKLRNYCSVFQSELFAIKKSIDYLFKPKFRDKRITICTDSLTTLKALSDENSTTYLVQTILVLLNRLADQNTRIEFVWIRGHDNNEGNELADKLAKERGGITSSDRIRFDSCFIRPETGI
jgi:ribonuclease HI